VAEEARSQSKDPEDRVDIPVATDLPEKASSLVITAKFPELEDSGVAERIREMESEYGKNDERVAFSIAREIAEGEFYEFDDLERACNAGIRVGVSYMTGGITTAPLEGIGEIKIRENNDGSEYLAVYYSGPIRSAGGTASAMSVLLSDYVRIGVGIDKFKPSETVVKRYGAEVEDYYNRVTAKQYNPERKETEMIAENVPIEVTGSPTESIDVSNYKDLDRVKSNRIRGGMCLVYLDGLPLKAPKIKKRIEKWGKEFGLEHWNWVGDYLDLQKEIHSSDDEEEGDEEESKEKYTASDKYLGSLTAGRPIFGHPGRKGGFRLRYGHSRTNGLAGSSFHPATMEITERFIAIGTQLKVEYPGKATVGTPCDTINPPVVRLENGDVVKVETRDKARELEDKIEEILFLGDILVPYGEFVENGKKLLPSPYVSEWWEKELEEKLEETGIELGRDFTERDPTPKEAFKISEKLDLALHPKWSYHWRETSPEKFKALYKSAREGSLEGEKTKQALEDILVQHKQSEKGIILSNKDSQVIQALLKPEQDNENLLDNIEDSEDIPEFIEEISGIEVRNQGQHYLGSRMGRPEKAERRTIKGKPQVLFPCGKEEGGRMRNLTAAYQVGEINEGIIHNRCKDCESITYFSYCIECGGDARPVWFCTDCGKEFQEERESCTKCGNERLNRYKWTDIDVERLVDDAKENLGIRHMPELLKSVRGMSGMHKHVEPIEKGLLRQKHDLYVNKDGTVRYDASDIPMSHFKPKEISVSVEKLREIGYKKAADGTELENEEQVVALKPQDIIIPDGKNTLAASDYFVRVANFIDDLLEQFYGLEPYYDVEEKQDLVGSLVIGLAPHTSGGTVGRIIGFTEAKGIYAHPYWHAAKRRNCFHPETKIWYEEDKTWSHENIGDFVESRMDNPREDDFGTKIQELEGVYVPSVNEDGKKEMKPVEEISKHDSTEKLIKITTKRGQSIKVTPDHKMQVYDDKTNTIRKERARNIEKGAKIPEPDKIDIEGEYKNYDLLKEFVKSDEVDNSKLMVKDLGQDFVKQIFGRLSGTSGGNYLVQASKKLSMNKKTVSNYVYRDSVPASILLECFKTEEEMLSRIPEDAKLGIKADSVTMNRKVELNAKLGTLLGYYAAEGFTRDQKTNKGRIKQTTISGVEKQSRDFFLSTFKEELGVEPYKENKYKVTVSGKLVNIFFKEVIGVGEGSINKKVPQDIFSSPDEIAVGFLRGYFSGDGSADKSNLAVNATTISKELQEDITALLKRRGISTRVSKNPPRKRKDAFPDKYGEDCEKMSNSTYVMTISSKDAVMFYEKVGFHLDRKQQILEKKANSVKTKSIHTRFEDTIINEVSEVETVESENRHTYCLTVSDNHSVIANNMAVGQCDGDEDAILLLMDGLLNFSRDFLPDMVGARTMDAPLILSTILNADEVDDEAWAVETVDEYPLEFYRETLEYKKPWDLNSQIEIGEDIVHSDEPYKHGYTHDTSSIENGPNQSEYVTLDEMSEKTSAQLGLGEKLKAVDENAVAELLLNKHFIPDIKGNLNAFSSQKMRCVDCNEKFRRVPLTNQTIAATGKTTAMCPECDGKVLLTIHEGTVKKYMQPAKEIIEEYEVSPYTRQEILVLNKTLQSLFGKADRQSGLKQFTN